MSLLTERVLTSIKRIGELRDGLLVAGGVLYLSGYVVRSINAKQNNLGLLPSLDLQYFLAGLGPVLIIAVALVMIRALGEFGRKLQQWLLGDDPGWRRSLRRLIVGCWVAALALFMVSERGPASHPWLSIPVLILTYLALWFLPGFLKWTYRWFFVYVLPAVFAVAMALVYQMSVYPKVRQEFGGPKPRCASLDLVRARVSTDSLKELVRDEKLKSNDPVVRSRQVDVYFSGSDFMLVQPVLEKHELALLHELRKDAVQAVAWCYQAGATSERP